jgi:hypothetical protein
MISLLTVVVFAVLSFVAPRVFAREPGPTKTSTPPAPPPERVQPLDLRALPEGPTGAVTVGATPFVGPRPTPRVKLSYLRHGIGDNAGGTIPLQALHLDLYPLSWRWLRAGVEIEAGRGRGTLMGAGSSVSYGLVGMNLGIQIPRRITPFIEGRVAGGVIQTRSDGAMMIPGTPIMVNGGKGSSFMLTRGIDLGVELYTFGQTYVSAAIGVQRTSWQVTDFNNRDAMVSKKVSYDSFLFKIGIGF